jgi:trimeric autotransporter adhesin
VPAVVTIPVGSTSATVTYSTVARSGAFLPEIARVHAEYAGVKLTASITIVPPRVVSVSLSPSAVTSGGSSTVTVALDRPSLNGNVLMDLLCGAPGFATLPVPPQLTIGQGQISNTFTITTPPSLLAFPTAQVSIVAIYRTGSSDPGTSASATLSVQSQVVAGILKTLTLFPTTVTAGGQSSATVTLIQAVPVATVVGLAALEPLSGGGRLPLAGNASTIASVPPSITIAAGQTSGHFTITTNLNVTPGTRRNVTIMAGAVQTQTATLIVTA